MNKKTKWGLIAIIGIGLAGMAIHTFMPRENKELAQAPGKPKTPNRSRTLNVIGEVIKEASISDGSNITGLLLPDEEVSLSFETSFVSRGFPAAPTAEQALRLSALFLSFLLYRITRYKLILRRRHWPLWPACQSGYPCLWKR